jgi:hypothetical protein
MEASLRCERERMHSLLCFYSFCALKKKLVERSSGGMMTMMNREKGKNKREGERQTNTEKAQSFIRIKKKYVCELVLFFNSPMPCFHLTAYVAQNYSDELSMVYVR